MELVGMEIRKNFLGFGVFTGTVQSYDAAAGYFKIQYEDGDYEEVDFEEIRSIIKEMGGSSPKLEHHARRSNRGRRPKKRRRLDSDPSVKPGTVINFESDCKNSELDETLVDERAGLLKENEHFSVPEEIQVNGGCNVDERRRKKPRLCGLDKSTRKTPLRRSARRSLTVAKCENLLVSQDDDLGGGKESASGQQDLSKLELPPSSNDLDLDGLNVFDLFSVYSCLRSFSRLLFLSPFRLETFVAALRCKYANFLIDSVHFSILQALKPHLEALSGEGSQSASECLRYLNWELLDLVTWPVFLVLYLRIHGSGMKPGFRLSQLKLLDSEYYKQPAGVKLEILRCLCDDVIEVDAIRSELNRRMDSEINVEAARNNMNIEKRRCSVSFYPSAEEADDGNIDECCLCGMDGSLICCDGCPAAFHSRCVGVAKDLLPEGDWYCPECSVEKSDGLKKLSKPSCGAELLGFDPHGRLYFGSCDRLLVSDSWESDTSYHCYNKNDLRDVISVLNSCYAYRVIVNAISMYWGFPIDASPSNTQYGNVFLDDKKENLEAQMHFEPPLPSKHDVLSDVRAEILAVGDSTSVEQCGPKSSQVSDLVQLNSVISHELVGRSCLFSCSESCDEIVHAAACSQPSQQTDTDLPMGSIASSVQGISSNHADLTAAPEKRICFPGWSCITDRKKPEPSDLQSDPDSYINYYSFGRTASSISAELMHKSSGETSIVSMMSVEDIKSAQLKAISNRITRDCCYAYQKLSMDVQKENCGWCFSCRTSSDFDCLFKVAGDKNLKGSKGKNIKGYNDKDLEDCKSQAAGPHSEKNKKSHITYAMHHILLIEARVRSLLSGPWEKPHYSQHWRKAVMKAPDVASLKPLLLALELNLRRVALSVEWSKPVDDAHAIVSASIVTSPVRGSSSYVGSRKLGKKNNSGDEFSFMSRRATNTISDIYWWRGGRLLRQLFQCKMLPRALASKGSRQAGCRKIPHILYPDSSDFANGSKYVSWRVAVEMSQSVAQLIYQAKDFDSNIKWAELSDTRLFPKLAKESKKKAKSMKKVHICGRCKEGKQVKYLLDVSKAQTIPTIVMKHGVLLEESTTGRKRYWLSEAHVPLNLLKSYEEKKMRKRIARLLKKTDSGKHHAKESKCKTNKRKRSEWLSYLVSKEQKSAKRLCGHCNKDVPLREAVNCRICGGFFHRKHFRVPKGAVGTTYTCTTCRETKDRDTQSVKTKDKDTKNVKAKAKDKKNAKAKEEDMENVNLTDREVSSVYVKAKGRKSVKAKEKDIKSTIVRNVRNKNKKSVVVEEKCRRSERVKQKYIRSLKVTARGHKTVSKRIKVSEGKKLEVIPKKRKHVFMTSKKKFNGHTRRMNGKSKNAKSEKSENGISFHKRKRSVVHHSYWLNGLLWTHKQITEQQRDFRERNIILALQDTDPTMKPLCCLCRKEYKSGVIYIGCELCQDWFHGDAFGLTVENITNLIGFRCHICLKRSEPVCPFSKSAAIGDADLDSDCGIGVNVVGNDLQIDEEKHCGSYIVCKEDHLDGEQREEACVEHKKDEEKDHGSLHEDCLAAAVHSEGHLDELHTENVIEEELGLSIEAILTNGYNKGLQQRNDLEKFHGNDHQNDETKHSGSSIFCKEDHFDCEQREEACVEHKKDREKDRGCLREDCWVTVHNEDHLDEQRRENVTEEELGLSSEAILTNGYIGVFQQRNHLENSHGNDHQNDEDKHCGSSVDCKEDHLDGEQRDKTCVEHQKDEEKGHGSLREDCLATGHNEEDHLDGLHRENIEEEPGLLSEPILVNGYIGDLEHSNDLEKIHGGSCEDCSSIVQSQDRLDLEQREDVILCEEEPSLCPKTVSENVDYVQSPQQVETNVASTNNENEIEVGLTLNGVVDGLYRMIKVPDSGSVVVGTHSDSVVLDPEIIRPAPDFDDVDADKS